MCWVDRIQLDPRLRFDSGPNLVGLAQLLFQMRHCRYSQLYRFLLEQVLELLGLNLFGLELTFFTKNNFIEPKFSVKNYNYDKEYF